MTKRAGLIWLCWLLVGAVALAACAGRSQPVPRQETAALTSPVSTPAAGSAAAPEGARVVLTAEDGVPLVGTYWATAPDRPAPGVLLLHMVGRTRGDWTRLARRLQAEEYAVLAIDLRGHGESGGKQDYPAMMKDVAAAYTWLRQQEAVAPDAVVLIGASIGANLALNFAAEEPSVRGLVLLSPGLDYRGIQTEAAMQRYGARPVLIVASEEDGYAASSSRTLDARALGPHQLKMYKGIGHGTDMLSASADVEDLIVQWLADALL